MPAPVPHVTHVTPLLVFESAPPIEQGIMVLLVLAAVAALAVLAVKLGAGGRPSSGSAFLSGLRFGGPIIGFLGACHAGLTTTLGAANAPIVVTPIMLAPGIAESFLMIGLGFLAGVVAVFAHWIVESRIDHRVLDA